MGKNRVLAERMAERIMPRLVALLESALDEELGGAQDAVPRVPGISQEGYELAAATAARWQSGGGRARKARKAG